MDANFDDKIKQKKPMLKKKAAELYMAGVIEMAALMNDHYAGKFKSSYNPKPWSKK